MSSKKKSKNQSKYVRNSLHAFSTDKGEADRARRGKFRGLDQSGHSRAKFLKNFKSSDFSTHVSNLIFFNEAKIPLKFID